MKLAELIKKGIYYGILNTEYYYQRKPEIVAKYLSENYSNKKILFYGNGAHTKEVLSHLKNIDFITGIIKDANNDPNYIPYNFKIPHYNMEEIRSLDFDFIVLLGYWSNKNLKSFIKRFSLDNHKVLIPYKSVYLQKFIKKDVAHFFEFSFTSEKPLLLLILDNDSKDMITICSKVLSEKFNMIKIYLEGKKIIYDNKFFNKTIILKGNVLILKDIIKEINPNIIFFFHTHPFLNLTSNFLIQHKPKNSKFIYATTDFFFNNAFRLTIPQLARFLNITVTTAKLIEKSEIFNVNNADAVVTNWCGKFFNTTLKNAKKKFCYNYFHNKNQFLVKEKQLDYPVKYCFAGNLAFNNRKIIHKIMTINKIFETILKQGHEIHCYHYQDSTIKPPYSDLLKFKTFYWEKFVPNDKIIEELSQYHIGLCLFNFDKKHLKIYETVFESLNQAKILTYLGAGLPVIVNYEYKKLRTMVEHYNVGLSVKYNEIATFNFNIDYDVYNDMKNNVKKFQTEYKKTAHEKNFTEFCLEILNHGH